MSTNTNFQITCNMNCYVYDVMFCHLNHVYLTFAVLQNIYVLNGIFLLVINSVEEPENVHHLK